MRALCSWSLISNLLNNSIAIYSLSNKKIQVLRKSGDIFNDLNKASAHLLTLGNNLYTKKTFLTNIPLFIVNKKNGRKRSEIWSQLIMKHQNF